MEEKRALAIGVFDGVHKGHAALLEKAKERAAQMGGRPAALSFDTHPDKLVHGREVPLISSCAGRKALMQRYFGIEDVFFLHFNRKMMEQSWRDFLDNIVEQLSVAWIVVGHDFHCGYKGEGNTERIGEYCAGHGIGFDVICPVRQGETLISSSYIRQLLLQGRMEEANDCLGHPYQLIDTVRPGFHRGTGMGTPTINLYLEEGMLIPRQGVYAARVFLEDGSSYLAATNVGVRPTVNEGSGQVSVESFLLDFSGNLYGRQVRVEFYRYLRPERRFASEEELARQIRRDAEEIREYFR